MMGIGGISPGSLLLIFIIAILVFGSKRVSHIGHDLGSALKNFRKGLKEESPADETKN